MPVRYPGHRPVIAPCKWFDRFARTMRRCHLAAVIGSGIGIALSTSTVYARPEPAPPPLEAIRAQDLQFAKLGYRLATANAPLCDQREPAVGIVFHSLSAYAPADRAMVASGFGFETDIGVEAVIPGSPADKAGISAGDSLVAIDNTTIDTSLPPRDRKAGIRWIAALHDAIALLPDTAPMFLTLRRNGQDRRVTLGPVPACRSRFELLLDSDDAALSDGGLVQIGVPILERHGDDTAAIIAHELAHNMLHHRSRMDAQGIGNGERLIGRDVAYFRRTETEADIVSVYLLANAGFDLAMVPRFWRAIGKRHDSVLNGRSHPKWADRLATMEQAIAAILADPAGFHLPALVATRDHPVSRDWAAILIRAKR